MEPEGLLLLLLLLLLIFWRVEDGGKHSQPKRRCPTTTPHGATQKTTNCIFTAAKTSNVVVSHYRVHKIPSLSQLNPVHNDTPCPFNTHITITFPPTPRSSKLLSSFQISQLKFCANYPPGPLACYIPSPSHPSWFGNPGSIKWK
jgi:hypothetical protein